jgi:hypothetical protein
MPDRKASRSVTTYLVMMVAIAVIGVLIYFVIFHSVPLPIPPSAKQRLETFTPYWCVRYMKDRRLRSAV